MRKYADYYNGRYNVFKENKAALYKEADELKELAAMLKAGLSEQQKADLDLIIDEGAAAPSGVTEFDEAMSGEDSVSVSQEGENIIEKQEHHSGVVVGDVFERVLGNGVLERRIVKCAGGDSYYFVEDEGGGREMIGEYAWTLQHFNLVKPSQLRSEAEATEGKEDAGSDIEPDTGAAELTQQQFVVGDVVLASLEDETLGHLVVTNLDDLVHVEDEKGHEWSFEYNDINLIHHTDVPCPGDGWERNMGVIPEGDVEAVCNQAGARADVLIDRTKDSLDWKLRDGPAGVGSIAWFKPKETVKDVADEQDLELSQNETVESDFLDGNAVPSGESDDSSSDADVSSVDAENGENHPLAQNDHLPPLHNFIMSQEWDGIESINMRDDIDVVFVQRFETETGGEKLLNTLEIGVTDFLAEYTPKGWERYDRHDKRKTYDPAKKYEVLGALGAIFKPMGDFVKYEDSENYNLFIREHKEEDEDFTPRSKARTKLFLETEFNTIQIDKMLRNDDRVSVDRVNSILKLSKKSGQTNDTTASELEAGEEATTTSRVVQEGESDTDRTSVFGGEVRASSEYQCTEPDSSAMGVDTRLPQPEHSATSANTQEDAQTPMPNAPSEPNTSGVFSGVGSVDADTPLEDRLLPNVGILTLVKFCGKENWRVDAIEPDEKFPYIVSHIHGDTQSRADKHMIEIQEQPPLEDNGLAYVIKEQAKELTPAEQEAVDLVEDANNETD